MISDNHSIPSHRTHIPHPTGMFWEHPWRLSNRVIHSWKAHAGGCRALAGSHDERLLVTAGAARVVTGQVTAGGDVVRCWRMDDLQAGM